MGTYQIKLQPNEVFFEVNENEIILDAVIRQNIPIAYTCRNGTCRTCLFLVVDGNVSQEEIENCMITSEEIIGNRRLLCMSTLKSDAVIEKVIRKKIRHEGV
jgi:ferredoxin